MDKQRIGPKNHNKIEEQEDPKRGIPKVSQNTNFWGCPDYANQGSRVGESMIFIESASSKSCSEKIAKVARELKENQWNQKES